MILLEQANQTLGAILERTPETVLSELKQMMVIIRVEQPEIEHRGVERNSEHNESEGTGKKNILQYVLT